MHQRPPQPPQPTLALTERLQVAHDDLPAAYEAHVERLVGRHCGVVIRQHLLVARHALGTNVDAVDLVNVLAAPNRLRVRLRRETRGTRFVTAVDERLWGEYVSEWEKMMRRGGKMRTLSRPCLGCDASSALASGMAGKSRLGEVCSARLLATVARTTEAALANR